MSLASLAALVLPVVVGYQRPEWESAAPMPPVVQKALSEQPRWRFTGTRLVVVRRGPDTYQHTEYVTRDGPRVRIEFPGDSRFSGQIITDNEQERRHFFPKKNEIHVTPSRREPLFDHIRSAWRGEHSVRVTEEAGDRVAGIPTRLVKVIDHAGNRLQELNIDPKSGVVLARRVFDDVGTQVGSFEFQQVNLHPNIDASVFQLKHNGATVTTPVDDLRKLTANSGFMFAILPPSAGLKLDSARVREIAGQRVLMSQYISPKGRVILFQLPVGVDPRELNQHAPKNVHAATVKEAGHWFVLVGPLDEDKLNSIASTLRTGT
jgi:hypothetical protein